MSKKRGRLFKTGAPILVTMLSTMKISDGVASYRPAILIVDDDASMLELYERTLSHDYQVFTCSKQRDALEILSTHHLHLVVLEPAIQGYRGWELLRTIKDTYGIPVIVCSALDDRKQGLEAGAVAYLVKPVLPMMLLQVLKRTLGQSVPPQE